MSSSLRARAAALPAWVWLAAIVVLSILFRIVLARRMVAPWIMVDELIYSELAKSAAAHGTFLIRGVPAHGFGFVYPLLIAPAFRVASVPTAYGLAKATGSIVMSLAAIPAYLLARRVVRPPLALFVAVLTLAVPSMVYTGTLMTETAFYPLFLGCALALVMTLERPTLYRIAVLLALTMLAFLTRAQAIAHRARDPDRAALPRPLAPARVPLALRDRRRAAACSSSLWEAVHGRSPRAALGAYQVTTSTHYSVASVLRWLVYHVGELDLYVGVVPFAALLFLLTTRERRSPFVAAAVSMTAWLLVEVAAFASTQSQRVEERNMFFVAPFFFVALCWWVERGLPRPRAAGVCAVIAAALVGVVPYCGADQRQRDLGHARAAAALDAAGHDHDARPGAVGRRRRRDPRHAAAPAHPRPLRDRAAGARARALRRGAVADRGEPARRHPARVGRCVVRRHLDAGPRLDRRAPRPSTRTSRCCSTRA